MTDTLLIIIAALLAVRIVLQARQGKKIKRSNSNESDLFIIKGIIQTV